jgi:hypothetical protein
MATQTMPPVWRMVKASSSGVACSAAKTRSPSFSRSSSSTTMTGGRRAAPRAARGRSPAGRPARGRSRPRVGGIRRHRAPPPARAAARRACASASGSRLTRSPTRQLAERGDGQRVRDQPQREGGGVELVAAAGGAADVDHGHGDAVDGDAPLGHQVAGEGVGRAHRHDVGARLDVDGEHLAGAADVAGDDVAAEAVAGAHGALEVGGGAGRPARRGLGDRLLGELDLEALGVVRDDGEAAAGDGDRRADGQVVEHPRLDAHAHVAAVGAARLAGPAHAADFFHDAGEHQRSSPAASAAVPSVVSNGRGARSPSISRSSPTWRTGCPAQRVGLVHAGDAEARQRAGAAPADELGRHEPGDAVDGAGRQEAPGERAAALEQQLDDGSVARPVVARQRGGDVGPPLERRHAQHGARRAPPAPRSGRGRVRADDDRDARRRAVGAVVEDAGGGRGARDRVEHDLAGGAARGVVALEPRRERRVVLQQGADADGDGVGLVAPAVHQRARRGAGDPAGAAGAGGDLAVERHRGLVAHPGAAEAAVGEVGGVEGVGLVAQGAGDDLDAGGAQARLAGAGHARVGVGRGEDDAGHAGGDQRVRAGGRAAVVGAGLERDVGGGAAGAAPAAASAAASAWGPPARSCQPSATASPPRASTQPTMGLGWVVPRPRSASASARRRWRRRASVRPGRGRAGGSAGGPRHAGTSGTRRCAVRHDASFSHPDCHRRHPVLTGSGPGGLRRLGARRRRTLAGRGFHPALTVSELRGATPGVALRATHTAGRGFHPALKGAVAAAAGRNRLRLWGDGARPRCRARSARSPDASLPPRPAWAEGRSDLARAHFLGRGTMRPSLAWSTAPDRAGRARPADRPTARLLPSTASCRRRRRPTPRWRSVHSGHAHLRPEARQPRHPRAARGGQPQPGQRLVLIGPVEALDLMRRIARRRTTARRRPRLHVEWLDRRADGPDPRPARPRRHARRRRRGARRHDSRPSSSAATPTCASRAATPT